MPAPDTKPSSESPSIWLHGAIFDAPTQRLLENLLGPFGTDRPVAVSILFRDDPFLIRGFALDGVLTEAAGGFRRQPVLSGAGETDPVWVELLAELDCDCALLCAVGDGIKRIRERGLELREGQAYLTPVSLSILNVEGRRLTANRPRSTEHHAIHFVKSPASPEERHHLHQVSGGLQACLDFLSDPGAANRTTAAAVRKCIPDPPEPRIPPREELDESLRKLKCATLLHLLPLDRPQ